MSLDQVTEKFKDTLCEVVEARIRAAVDGANGTSPTPLKCDVVVTAGSVIAATTVILPASTDLAAVSSAVSNLSANLAADINGNAELAAFGPIDPPQISQVTVDVVPADVAPVISDTVTLEPPTSRLAAQTGTTVTLAVTFVQNTMEDGSVGKAIVPVTEFAADDVNVVAQFDGTLLPVAITVEDTESMWYRIRISQDTWPAVAQDSCEDLMMTVTVPAGAALTEEGDSTRASAELAVPWRPGADDICGEIDSDKGNVCFLR